MEQEQSTVELKFEVRDPGSFFVAASGALDCRVVNEDVIFRSDGKVLEYYTVAADPAATRQFAESFPGVRSARIVRTDAEDCLLELVFDRRDCVSSTLATTHAVVKRTVAEEGTGMVVAEVPDHADASEVVDAMLDRHAGTALLSKLHRDDSDLVAVTGAVGTERYLAALTAKQRDAVRAAVQGGYLAWPRRSSASECAAALGISQPTFSQHLYRGLEVLLLDLFDLAEEESEGVTPSHEPFQDRQ